MSEAIYTLHVNDCVIVPGLPGKSVPGIIQGRVIRDGEMQVLVAIHPKYHAELPPEWLHRYHGGPFVVVAYPIGNVRKENGHA